MTEFDLSGAGKNVELLAPAGNAECLHAAVAAGADAVYLGLGDFNARRGADNFTMESLAEACDYAHLRGVAIYVALNIAILPSEIDRAVETARQAVAAGVDAVIVEDLGLAARIRQEIPQVELHISTQLNTHSAAGIEAAARLGASRVTLARELSFAEIASLAEVAADFGMTVETFAHGALCVCYSGQCLMSSLIGGRSANRGTCAQACRLPYELQSDDRSKPLPAAGAHLLSPRDFCTAEVMPQMVASGTSSLKIEGRMKSATYVFSVVSVYRDILDRALAGRDARPTEQQRGVLSEAFSRGFTTAYLTGDRGNEIMSYGRPNNRGVLAGRVSEVKEGFVEIATHIELNPGDVVEFWTKRGHFACPLTAASFTRDGRVHLAPEQKVGKGDRVFRVRNAAAEFTDDALEPRVPVIGRVRLALGEPARVEFSLAHGWRGVQRIAAAAFPSAVACEEQTRAVCGYVGAAEGAPVELARTKPLSTEDVESHIDRFGQTPFALVSLDIELSEGAGMGFSQLHRLRSEALVRLQEQILDLYAAKRRSLIGKLNERSRQNIGFAETLGASAAATSRKRPDQVSVVAWASNPACARAAKRAGADVVYIPILNYKRGESVLAGVRREENEQAGYPKQKVMALPTVDHDPIEGTREDACGFDVWDYVREGKRVFADSLASCVRAQAYGALVELGPHVPLTNAAGLRLVEQWGVARVWLSPELTLGQIADLADGSSVPLGITVSGAQELMVTEHCLLMSQGPCDQNCAACRRRNVEHHLKDRKGFDFPVVTDSMGRSHLYNGIELDIVPCLPDLLSIGISSFMVDTTLMDKNESHAAVSRVVRALKLAREEGRSVEKRRGTTTGHLFRGVS